MLSSRGINSAIVIWPAKVVGAVRAEANKRHFQPGLKLYDQFVRHLETAAAAAEHRLYFSSPRRLLFPFVECRAEFFYRLPAQSSG